MTIFSSDDKKIIKIRRTVELWIKDKKVGKQGKK